MIGFATTALLLTVALRAYQVAGHDDVEAFGDSLARDPDSPDGLASDASYLGPDEPTPPRTSTRRAPRRSA